MMVKWNGHGATVRFYTKLTLSCVSRISLVETHGANRAMGSLRFVVMEGSDPDYPAIFRSAVSKLDLPARVETYPYIEPAGLTRAKLSRIRNLLERQANDEMVFFC